MKIILAIVTALGLVLPAYANDDQEILANPTMEWAYLVRCNGLEFTLMHLHNQIAASLTVLSAQNLTPQLALLVESYKTMAAGNQKMVQTYLQAIKDIIPQIVAHGVSPDEILDRTNQMMNKTIFDLTMTMTHSTNVDDQVGILRPLLEQSHACESMVNNNERRR